MKELYAILALINHSKAAENLKLTAQDLLSLEVIDEIIKEPIGGAHRNIDETCALIKGVC